MNQFKPEFLKWSEIWDIADKFRKENGISKDTVPFPIEEVVEINLGIEVIPITGMKSKTDMEGFISNNLKQIFVDGRLLNNMTIG